jgi:hypothetical protein
MEWCDAFSLLLCRREVQPEGRAIEVSRGPDNVKYNLFQIAEGKQTLDPWPFEPPGFEVYFESRMVKQLQFKDSEELRTAFRQAPVTETRWELLRAKAKDNGPKVKAR